MQNGFQFCPTAVLCFIIIESVRKCQKNLACWEIFLPLFQSYSESVTVYLTVHISRDWQGGGG